MANTVTGGLDISTRATVADAGPYPAGTFTLPTKTVSLSWGSGSTTGNVDLLYEAQVATGTTLVLTDASLKDPRGQTLAIVHISKLFVHNPSATATATLSGTALGAITGGTPSISILPGAVVVFADPGPGWAITAGQTLIVGGTLSALNIEINGRSA